MALVSPVNPSDPVSIRKMISKLASSSLGPTSSPVFVGITLTGLTANSLMYPASGGLVTSLGAATNGQLPIGNTGNPPTIASITGTANQITMTAGAGSITLSIPSTLYVATSIDLGHADDTTITRSGAGQIAVQGVDVMMIGDSPTAHVHNTDTLQLDAVNSDGGAFAFSTTGKVTFNQNVAVNGLSVSVVAKTAAYTATATDDVITCGAGNETFTIDLPAPATGKTFYIKNVGTGVITVDADTTGSTTIDGDTTQTVNQYECLKVVSDASVYWAI